MSGSIIRGWLKLQVRLGLPFYFRKLKVVGADYVPASGPLLFAANHQNSFLDALMVTVTQRRDMHYLVRSDVFRKPLARRALTLLHMLPVFRIRDGWNTLGNNGPTFERCVEIFRNGGAVLIFPEGNHSTFRRLRPLSRGFTKPIGLALDSDSSLPIMVVPVGLNFSNHTAFRAPASVHFGMPIPVQDHIREGRLDANSLREALAAAMKKLIVHIEDPDSCERVESALRASGADLTDPVSCNALIGKLQEEGLSPIIPAIQRKGLTWPFRVLHYLPLAGWYRLQKTIRDPMFTGSLKSVYGIFVFPAYYALIGIISWSIGGALLLAMLMTIMLLSVVAYRN